MELCPLIKFNKEVSVFDLMGIVPSRNMSQAYMKHLKIFRKWCRFMPYIIHLNAYRKYTDPERAKL